MTTLKENDYILLRRALSIVVFSLYILQLSYLYLNTRIVDFDSLEFIKFFGPISLLLIFTTLNRIGQEVFVKFMVFTLYAHIAIALIFLSFNFTDSITSDNRLVLSILGRSPGATAQIFCVALVVYDYYLKDRILGFNNLGKIIKALFIVIVLLTQARTYYIFLIFYFLINHWNIFRNSVKLLRVYFFTTLAGVIIYLSGIADEIFERSLGDRLFSGRESIWEAFFNNIFSRGDGQILFGSDLSRHLITVSKISYETSDVHNTFLDILNYYGLVFLLLFLFWYIFSSGFFRSKKSFTILVSYFPVLMLSAVFKFPFAFYSSLLILLLPIYFNNIRHSEKETL